MSASFLVFSNSLDIKGACRDGNKANLIGHKG